MNIIGLILAATGSIIMFIAFSIKKYRPPGFSGTDEGDDGFLDLIGMMSKLIFVMGIVLILAGLVFFIADRLTV